MYARTWPYFRGLVATILMILVAFSGACGEPETTPTGSITGGGDNSSSDSGTSSDDAQSNDDAGYDDAGDTDQSVQCRQGSPLGTLSHGDQGTITLALESTDRPAPACMADDAEPLSAAAIEFDLDQPSLIEWTYVTDLPHQDVATGPFDDHCAESAHCRLGRSQKLFYDQGMIHLVETVVAGAPDPLSLHFQVEPALCSPPGHIGCDEGQAQICYDGHHLGAYDCADQSCQGDRCAGDDCQQALILSAGTAQEPTLIEGHRNGYTHNGHLAEMTDCTLDNIADDRPELFLAVEDIPAGHDLVIESQGQGSYGFFAFDGCQASRCLAIGSMDDDFQNRLRFTPDDGVHSTHLAIRPSDPVERSFRFAIFAIATGEEL